MRSKNAIWFEAKVRYQKTMEDGVLKNVTETYVVDAMSFSEAEERTIEELSPYISGEMNVVGLKIASYKEVLFDDVNTIAEQKYFKAKVGLISIDERTQKEKVCKYQMLVPASNIDKVKPCIDEVMSGTMIDYELLSVSDTSIIDVFEYEKK